MKRIIPLSPLLIIIITYVPSLTFRLVSYEQSYSSVDKSTLFLLSSIWLMGCQSAWLWASGISLATKLNPLNNTQLLFHKLCLIVPIGYVILPLATLMSVFMPINFLFPFLTFDFYSHWHTISLLCFIYPIFFIAKSLTTLEAKKTTVFSEYVSTILTIIIFPIGIFFVQPRIKRLVNGILGQKAIV